MNRDPYKTWRASTLRFMGLTALGVLCSVLLPAQWALLVLALYSAVFLFGVPPAVRVFGIALLLALSAFFWMSSGPRAESEAMDNMERGKEIISALNACQRANPTERITLDLATERGYLSSVDTAYLHKVSARFFPFDQSTPADAVVVEIPVQPSKRGRTATARLVFTRQFAKLVHSGD